MDTNIFINIPSILTKFNLAKDKIYVPRAMEQELDKLQHHNRNAKLALSNINRAAKQSPQFVRIQDNINIGVLPEGYDQSNKDNYLLALAIELDGKHGANNGKIIIVTDDVSLRSNAQNLCDKNTFIGDVRVIDSSELLRRLEE